MYLDESNMTDKKPLRERLLAEAGAGRLLEAAYTESLNSREERDDLARELAALHNEGLVDIVVAFEGLKNNAPSGPCQWYSNNPQLR